MYIVWDINKKKFSTDVWYNIQPNGKLWRLESGEHIDCSNTHSIHYYINKNDINGEKIYENSSIISFSYWMGTRHVELNGYFVYDSEKLLYKIELLNKDKLYNCVEFSISSMIDIEIIDTIQENKLGLVENV